MEHEDTPGGREVARMTQAVLAGCAAIGQRAAHNTAAAADQQRRVVEQQTHAQRARHVRGITITR